MVSNFSSANAFLGDYMQKNVLQFDTADGMPWKGCRF
jgi:hypothetical protein